MVGIFPNEAAIVRLIGAVLLEQNDEWQLQHRHMQLEAMAKLTPPAAAELPQLPPQLAWSMPTSISHQIYTSLTDVTPAIDAF